jgi:hypothetical protein
MALVVVALGYTSPPPCAEVLNPASPSQQPAGFAFADSPSRDRFSRRSMRAAQQAFGGGASFKARTPPSAAGRGSQRAALRGSEVEGPSARPASCTRGSRRRSCLITG